MSLNAKSFRMKEEDFFVYEIMSFNSDYILEHGDIRYTI